MRHSTSRFASSRPALLRERRGVDGAGRTGTVARAEELREVDTKELGEEKDDDHRTDPTADPAARAPPSARTRECLTGSLIERHRDKYAGAPWAPPAAAITVPKLTMRVPRTALAAARAYTSRVITAHDVGITIGAGNCLGASFRVDAGDRIGLVGRNGAGKTTLTKVLAGEGEPTRGTVQRTGSIGYLPRIRGRGISTNAPGAGPSARDLMGSGAASSAPRSRWRSEHEGKRIRAMDATPAWTPSSPPSAGGRPTPRPRRSPRTSAYPRLFLTSPWVRSPVASAAG